MIPAAFGIVQAALDALDHHLDESTLNSMAGEDIAAAWQAAAGICRTADDVYNRVRAALTNEFIRTPRGTP